MRVGTLLAPLFPELGRPLRGDDSPSTLGAWDSVKHVEIILTVEEALRVDLTTREIVGIDSVAALVRILRDRGIDAEV